MIGSLALLLSPASAATWTVCPEGTCDFETIGDAVTSAADGDEILVGEGVYDESIALEDRTLTFAAAELALPVVRGDGVSDVLTVRGGTVSVRAIALLATAGRAVTVGDDAQVTLSYVSLAADEPQVEGGVVHVEGAALTIEGAFLTNGLAVSTGGLVHAADADVWITDSLLDGGGARQGGGVASLGSSWVSIVDTRMANGLAEHGGAIYVAGGEVEVVGSEIVGNWASAAGGGAMVAGGHLGLDATWARENETSVTGGAVYVGGGGTARIVRSELTDNVAGEGGGVYVAEAAVVEITGTRLYQNVAVAGGGAYNGGELESTQNVYCMNQATYGGGISSSGTTERDALLLSYNDVFNENVADEGGAVSHGWGASLVSQATVVGNQGNDQAASVINWAGELALTRSIVAHHPAPAHGSSLPSVIGATVAESVFWEEANGLPDGAGEPADPMFRFSPGGDCDDYLWPSSFGAAARLGAPADGDPIDFDGTLADLGATGGTKANPNPWFTDWDDDGHVQIYDCDDNDAAVFPGAAEGWYDGIDGDCDMASDLDQDGDGFDAADHGGADCDDLDPGIHPGAPEVAGNDVDEDCDAIAADDGDGDGFSAAAGDCDDGDPNVNPNENDRDPAVDRDCDGVTDVRQSLRPTSCSTSPAGSGAAAWLLLVGAAALRRRAR